MAQAQSKSKKAEKTHYDVGMAYDQVPYKGNSYPMSHPRHLSVVGKLFGLNPPAPEKARILEIGCASGGNLIPLGLSAPQCTCLGIDLSSRQIEEGRRVVAELGLENVILEPMSVSDMTPELGPFDYIICHGVFSWVPADVQEDILRVCSENLAPDGLAYISYNTLPGWNGVRSIRDMMIYHTAQFSDPAVKVEEAVKMMRFVVAGLPQEDNLWRRMVENELKVLENMDSWYIYHEHLEKENNPIYFHDFMTLAQEKGLRYVGESQLSTMNVRTLAKPVADKLSQITDIVRQEQYMDFVRNRRFRMTILTHADQKPNFTVSTKSIAGFYVSAGNLTPDFDVKAQDWGMDVPRTFNKKVISTNNRYISVILALLCEHSPRLFAVEELLKEASARLGPKSLPLLRAAWNEYALQLCFLGHIGLHDGQYGDVPVVSEKPKALPLARYQAQKGETVVNARHENIRVDKAVATLLPLLDGTRTVVELTAPYVERLLAAGANFLENGVATKDPARRLEIATQQIRTCLEVCRAHKLLVG